jgi:glycosyltransferase
MNSASTIKETLDSVINQTYRNIEIIVIDGNSSDSTQSIVKSYGPAISQFVSENDRGSSDALNKGVARATGDVITFLNSDDVFLSPLVLEKVAECFNDPELDYVGGAIQWIDDKTGRLLSVRYSRPDRLLFGVKAFLPGSFFRRSVIPAVPFTDEIDFANDYDIICNIIVRQKRKYVILRDVILGFRLGGRSSSPKNLVRVAYDLFLVRKKYFGLAKAILFLAPEIFIAFIRQKGFRPKTWGRKVRSILWGKPAH